MDCIQVRVIGAAVAVAGLVAAPAWAQEAPPQPPKPVAKDYYQR